MPRIPTLPIQKGLPTSGFQLSFPTPKSIGVSRARGATIPSVDRDMGLQDVSRALGDVADYFALKAENTRVAKSQNLQMDVTKTFREMWKEEAQLTGEQTDGQLERFQDLETELREQLISEDLGSKTRKELTRHFNSQFTAQAGRIVNHVIAQSVVADNAARLRVIQDAREGIAGLPVGDKAGIDMAISGVLKREQERHPNLTETQVETNRRSLQEDFLTFAITKWTMDNPVAAVSFWDDNQGYVKKALPKTYNVMAQKIDGARGDATYDIALSTLKRVFKNDDAAAAKFVDEDDKGVLKLTPSQRLTLASTLWASYSHKIKEEDRARGVREEEYLMSSIEKYYNPKTNSTNTQGALADLEIARRKGIVDSTTYRSQREKLMEGVKFSSEESHELMSNIDQRKITTKGEILAIIYGKEVNPEPYYSALEKRTAQVNKGFTDNWLDMACAKFISLAQIDDEDDLPSGLAEKGLLVNLSDLGAFKERLEAEAKALGYAAGDVRIRSLADDLIVGGWYSRKRPEFHPGEAKSWFIRGEKYVRKWQYDAGKLFREGKIPFLPEGEIATSGNLGVDMSMTPKMPIRTPEEEEAYLRLEEEGIPITKAYLKETMEYLAKQREE